MLYQSDFTIFSQEAEAYEDDEVFDDLEEEAEMNEVSSIASRSSSSSQSEKIPQ